MAITSNTGTGNGSNKLFSFTFPYLETSDIDVYLNGVLQTITTQYFFANATTVEFVTAPGAGVTVLIKRSTDEATISNSFFPGSSIKAADLNDNFNQVLFLAQETNNNVANAVAGQIPDGTITSAKIADGAIVNVDVSATAGLVATKLAFTQSGTGAVTRTVDSKLKDVVSVKDFGAVGNGVADDTDAITNALAALLSRGGGTLFFPTGIYLISAGIPLVGKVHYKGEGREASIIRQSSWDAVIGMGYRTGIAEDPGLTGTGLNSDATIPAKLKQSATTRLGGIVPTLNYWKISDLTLDGGANPANQIHKDDAFGNVIRMELHAYGEICSCNIINSWNQGVSIYFYSSDITIHDCTFKNIGEPGGTAVGYLGSRFYTGNAIFVEFSGDRTIVSENLFEDVDQRLIWYTCQGEAGDNKQKDHIFVDNIGFYSGSTAAVEAVYSGTYSSGYERIAGIHGLRIEGNRLIAASSPIPSYGITLGNATSVTVSGNYIYNRYYGMFINNSRGSVTNNIFHTCAIAGIYTNEGLAVSSFKPYFSGNQLVNTPQPFNTDTVNGIDTSRNVLVFGSPVSARTVAASGTLNLTLAQGGVTFSANRFAYRCSLQLQRSGGGFNFLQAEFYIAKGFDAGGGFRTAWGVTTPTWLVDIDNLRTNFSLSLNSGTGVLTLTSTDATFAYGVGLTIEYIDIKSLV